MEFSPPFPLLMKFTKGLRSAPVTKDDVASVARYLGVDLPEANLEVHIEILVNELSNQNRFLSMYRESESVQFTREYSRSLFIREIVEHKKS